MRGDSTLGFGVYGRSRSNYGVQGVSSSSCGIYGESDTSGDGVWGKGTSGGYDFYAKGAGVDYGSSSSIRWKTDIRLIDTSLEKISAMRGVYFTWDQDHGGHHDVGMIAEEVGEVLPEIVTYEENGIDAKGMDYSKITPLLVEAVKALKAENDSLRKRLEAIEATVLASGD